MYSVHFYAATHKQWLRDRVQAAVSAGIPVFVSESSGAEASGAGPNNFEEWKAWTDDYSNLFQVFQWRGTAGQE